MSPAKKADGDKLLTQVRKICLALPEAEEVESHGHPAFKLDKIFAQFVRHEDLGHPFGVTIKPAPDEHSALEKDPRFYAPPFWGSKGWLTLDLTAADVDWAEVTELVETSYRQVALKRQVKLLDDR